MPDMADAPTSTHQAHTGQAQCPTGCGRPSPNGHPCTPCTGTIVALLDDTAWLYAQLDLTITRQTRFTSSGGRKSAETPLPVNLAASDARGELVAAVTRLARAIGSDRLGDLIDRTRPQLHAARTAVADARAAEPPDPAAVAEAVARRDGTEDFLARLSQAVDDLETPHGALTWVRTHLPTAKATTDLPARLAGLETAHAKATKAIDRPVELVPLGECGAATIRPGEDQPCACSCHNGSPHAYACDIAGGCGSLGCHQGWRPGHTHRTVCERRLYAQPGDTIVTCPLCGTPHDVRARRDRVLEEAEHMHGRAHVLAAVMTAVGLPTTSAQIRGWARMERDREGTGIRPTHVDSDGTAWYRLGDVRDKWHRVQTTRDQQQEAS